MRTAVLSTVALVLLSQPAVSQALGSASTVFGQVNATLGQINGTLGSLGINSGVGSVPPATPPAVPPPVGPAAPPAGAGTGGGGGGGGHGSGSVSVPAASASAPDIVSSKAAISSLSASPAFLPTSLRPLQQRAERAPIYPSDIGGVYADAQARRGLLRDQGASLNIVQLCRNAVAMSAMPYGAIGLDTAAAGPVRSTPAGYRITILARVLYSRSGGSQIRQAAFNCQLNRAGQVMALR